MTRKLATRTLAVLLALTLVAACSTADDDESATPTSDTDTDTDADADADADTDADSDPDTDTDTDTEAGDDEEADDMMGEDLMWDDGPCSADEDPVKLGLLAPFNAGAISLEDQALAAEASAVAFNERGGINGRCIEMVTCDDGADPNQAADCARSNVDAGVVAEINDSNVAGPDVVVDTFLNAGVPRLDGAPAPIAFSAANTYTLGMGSLGNVVMMVPPLADAGYTKYALIRADVAGAAALPALMEPMTSAYGGEIVADIPVTAGTSDFSQFVLAAQNAGADSLMMATGREETLQVLRAAQQLDTDLAYSLSLGSVSREDIQEFGDFAENFYFNTYVPPASADPEPYPLLAVAVREVAATGEPTLQQDTITTSALGSWVYMYALVKMIRDAGITEIMPDTVTTVLNEAQDVDLGGLTPPWTPNATSDGVFERVSMPYYWVVTWDAAAENFVVEDEQVDAVAALAGDVG